jgi:hypothetical protein
VNLAYLAAISLRGGKRSSAGGGKVGTGFPPASRARPLEFKVVVI